MTVLVFTDCVDWDYVVTSRCNLVTSPGETDIEAMVVEQYSSNDEDDLDCGEGLVLDCGSFIPEPSS